MRALLLAAGLGTRLKPLTNYLPKCMAPIHGRPLIDYWLENLLDHGIKEVLINVHYMDYMVREYLDKSSWSPYVKVIYEEVLLGTGGTIRKNSNFFQDETFLVAHADNLTIFDLEDFTRQHHLRTRTVEISAMVFLSNDPHSCGIVEIDSEGIVQAFHEKVRNPPGNLANGAVYIIEPSVLDWIKVTNKRKFDFSIDVIPYFLGKIFAYHNNSYHRDIGTMNSWREANRDFPKMPARLHNRVAWQDITKKEDGHLERIIWMLNK